jgi:hypothetical protein
MIDQPRTRRPFRWLFLVLVVTGIVVVWLAQRLLTPRPLDPAPQPGARAVPIPPFSQSRFLNTRPEVSYIGSAACAGCHAENHKSFRLTAHSRSFSDVDPKREPPDGSFDHVLSGRSYRVYRKDGQLRHAEAIRTAEGKEIARVDLPVRYLVGSGHFSRTYVVEVAGYLHESPITWYASKQKWGMSPGYDVPRQPGFERSIEVSCLFCHAGKVVEEGKAANRLTFHEKAIGCENCHGPGSLHQEFHRTKKLAKGQDDLTIVHPGKLSRGLQEAICASCHQSGPASIWLRGRSPGDFRPGAPLNDYLIHYAFTGGNDRMTVVGHVDQLRQSACYRKSRNLTCVSCHDPHHPVEPKDKPAFYREQCLSCHTTQPCKLERSERLETQQDNCVACHMPRSGTDIPHIAFTHHRIGRHGTKPPVGAKSTPELVAVDDVSHLGPLDQKRNLALAYLEVGQNSTHREFAGVFQARARKHLEAVYTAGLRDGLTTAALAEISWRAKDYPRASSYAHEAIESQHLSPASRAVTLLYLADCELRDRDVPEAILHLEESVRLLRSADGWRLLGVSYLEQGQLLKALFALEESLAIRPDLYRTHLFLAHVHYRLGNIPLANKHQQEAQWLKEHEAAKVPPDLPLRK